MASGERLRRTRGKAPAASRRQDARSRPRITGVAPEKAESYHLILDAAEKLFAERQYDSVSLRDITGLAKVNLGLAFYHFRTKDALFEQLIARRIETLTQARRTALSAIEVRGKYDLREIVDAFIHPIFDYMQHGGEGWRNYIRTLPQLVHGRERLHLFDKYFDETAHLYIKAIKKALPGVSDVSSMAGFNFMLHSMLNSVLEHQRIDTLSRGRIRGNDIHVIYPKLLQFVVAGLKGLASADRKATKT